MHPVFFGKELPLIIKIVLGLNAKGQPLLREMARFLFLKSQHLLSNIHELFANAQFGY
jgi:hypothetical protein